MWVLGGLLPLAPVDSLHPGNWHFSSPHKPSQPWYCQPSAPPAAFCMPTHRACWYPCAFSRLSSKPLVSPTAQESPHTAASFPLFPFLKETGRLQLSMLGFQGCCGLRDWLISFLVFTVLTRVCLPLQIFMIPQHKACLLRPA